MSNSDGYRGLFGAYPYAIRMSRSRIFRVYTVVGGLVALLIAVVFALGVVVLFGSTAGLRGGTMTFSRSFYLVVMLLVVVPLVAPVLLVARRHRRGGSTVGYDRAMAIGGFLVIISLYVALIISAPSGQRDPPPAAIAPVIEALYALPPAAAVLPPAIAAAVLAGLHRRFR